MTTMGRVIAEVGRQLWILWRQGKPSEIYWDYQPFWGIPDIQSPRNGDPWQSHVATPLSSVPFNGDLRAAFPFGRLWTFRCQRFLAGWRGASSFMLWAWGGLIGCEKKQPILIINIHSVLVQTCSKLCFGWTHPEHSWVWFFNIPSLGMFFSGSKLSTRSLWRNTWRVWTLVDPSWVTLDWGTPFCSSINQQLWLLIIKPRVGYNESFGWAG